MEDKKKFNLSDCSNEYRDLFMKEFQELLDKHSLYFEPIPTYQRDTFESPWQIKCNILLQKRTEIVEPIVSDNPEVNPAI